MIPNSVEVSVEYRINCVLGDEEADAPNACVCFKETPMFYYCGMPGSHCFLEGVRIFTLMEIK